MHVDPLLPPFVCIALAVLGIGFVAKRLGQPMVVAYLFAGVLLGKSGLSVIDQPEVLSHLGAVGVVFRLFFAGLEIDMRQLLERWRVAVVGTVVQIIVTVGCVWAASVMFGIHWPMVRIVLLGFVVSLSSTAVVLKLLHDRGETHTQLGRDIIGVLLVQDLAVIPMVIILSMMSGDGVHAPELALQLVGGAFLIGLLVFIHSLDMDKFPFRDLLENDQEIQVYAALLICLGLALISGLFRLSSAMGAFLAGVIISATPATRWAHDALQPFHVFFLGLFFISVGMLLDVQFLREKLVGVSTLVALVFLTNTFLSAIILRLLGESWAKSFYAGSLLSQIGEFSFVLAAAGLASRIISPIGYNYTIATIALSLLLSSFWVAAVRAFLIRLSPEFAAAERERRARRAKPAAGPPAPPPAP